MGTFSKTEYCEGGHTIYRTELQQFYMTFLQINSHMTVNIFLRRSVRSSCREVALIYGYFICAINIRNGKMYVEFCCFCHCSSSSSYYYQHHHHGHHHRQLLLLLLLSLLSSAALLTLTLALPLLHLLLLLSL